MYYTIDLQPPCFPPGSPDPKRHKVFTGTQLLAWAGAACPIPVNVNQYFIHVMRKLPWYFQHTWVYEICTKSYVNAGILGSVRLSCLLVQDIQNTENASLTLELLHKAYSNDFKDWFSCVWIISQFQKGTNTSQAILLAVYIQCLNMCSYFSSILVLNKRWKGGKSKQLVYFKNFFHVQVFKWHVFLWWCYIWKRAGKTQVSPAFV